MPNAFLLRANPDENRRLVDKWKEMGVIAIGWAATGDLSGLDQPAIRRAISSSYTYSASELSKCLFACDMLVNRMKVGDYVLVPDPDNLKIIYVFQLEGEYYYDPGFAGWPHQRRARYLADLNRYDLSEPLQARCRSRRAAVTLTDFSEEIRRLVQGEPMPAAAPAAPAVQMITSRFRLRLDVEAVVTIPADLTQSEAERLASYVRLLCMQG